MNAAPWDDVKKIEIYLDEGKEREIERERERGRGRNREKITGNKKRN